LYLHFPCTRIKLLPVGEEVTLFDFGVLVRHFGEMGEE
jgi:hypothetical protein